MFKFILFLTLFTVTVHSKNINFKVCGQELTDTIQRYCSGKYFPRLPVESRKRSSVNRDLAFQFNPNNEPSLDNELMVQSLDIPPNDYTAITGLLSRERRQGLYLVSNIVNDCCKNSCSLRKLLSYCYDVEV